MNQDIEQAIQNFRANTLRYAKTERYYRGDHDLTFATEKFQTAFGTLFRQFAMNLCPAICDAVRDKLIIKGFGVDELGGQQSAISDQQAEENHPVGEAPPPLLRKQGSQTVGGTEGTLPTGRVSASMVGKLHSLTDRIWAENRMALRAGEVHLEALKNGDAYAVVWFDPEGRPTIYPQRAANCTVVYDEELPGRVAWAAKYWRTADKRTRLNLFYADRIERYISKRDSDVVLPEAKEFVAFGSHQRNPERTTPAFGHPSPPRPKGHPSFERRGVWRGAFTPETLNLEPGTIPNPYGIVPVFHFANNADIGAFGQSELVQALPVQDGLNKSILDMLVAMEYSAYRQRWVAGIDVEIDEATGKPEVLFKAGVDHLWVSGDPNTRFGDFGTTDLDQFLKVKDSFRVDIASVTGTPLHYFLQNIRGIASGEALRKVETRFLAKVRNRQTAFGQAWEDVMTFALRLAGRDGVRLVVDWEDPAPLEDREMLENILLKKRVGISTEQALIEAGYGDEDVMRMSQNRER